MPDPAGLAAVDITNPQTWNRYAYVGNNPLNTTDPLGLYCPVWERGCSQGNSAGFLEQLSWSGSLGYWSGSNSGPDGQWVPFWVSQNVGAFGVLPTNVLNGLWNAWKGLRRGTISANCAQKVLKPLGVSTQQFQNFLNQNPSFYNGPTSTVPAYGNVIQRGFWNWLTTSGSTTVAQTFAPGTMAETLPGANSLIMFASPDAVDMSNFGTNAPNEAMLFHEALHGVSGIASDQTIQMRLLGPSGVDLSSTMNITNFIQDQCIQ